MTVLSANERSAIRTALDRRRREDIDAETVQAGGPRITATLELLNGLAGLTRNEREVWVDRHLCKRMLSQIAQSMGKTVFEVRELEFRATKKLETRVRRDHLEAVV